MEGNGDDWQTRKLMVSKPRYCAGAVRKRRLAPSKMHIKFLALSQLPPTCLAFRISLMSQPANQRLVKRILLPNWSLILSVPTFVLLLGDGDGDVVLLCGCVTKFASLQYTICMVIAHPIT